MSIHFNRKRFNKGDSNQQYKRLMRTFYHSRYNDYNHPYRNNCKTLYSSKWRMFRTWKHSRKTQYKQ